MKIKFIIGNLKYFNSYAFVYPIYQSLKLISESVDLIINYSLDEKNYDLIFVDSKLFYEEFNNSNTLVIFETLKKLKKKCKFLIYCDNEASLFVNSKIHKYVDFYLKSKLPRDENYYNFEYYGLRSYTDFYHKKFNIIDNKADYSEILSKEDQSKNILGWNNGICDYSLFSNLKRTIFSLTKFTKLLKFNVKTNIKKINLSSRIIQNYSRNTINFQRDYILKNFSKIANTERVNKLKYFNELSQSYSSLSPFGWGEICYRDFEIFFNSSMLIKPSMNHIRTWPDYYRHEDTYIGFNWDFSNLDSILSKIDDKEYCINIGSRGNNYFMKFFKDEGKVLFVNYLNNIFKKIIK